MQENPEPPTSPEDADTSDPEMDRVTRQEIAARERHLEVLRAASWSMRLPKRHLEGAGSRQRDERIKRGRYR